MMTYITLALLGKVDENVRKRIAESTALKDYLIHKNVLLATSENKVSFEGVTALQMELQERQTEDLIALIAEADVDYSLPAYRIYADPFNTTSLAEDNRVGDGFIIKAGSAYDSPEDNLRLLRALKAGAKITSVHRRSGEISSTMDNRMLLSRCGPYHPLDEEILRPFQGKEKKTVKIQVLAFSVKNGRITVDNTYKPKNVKFHQPKPGF
ncbi:MAG: fructose 1,6-bisphosphatase [Candidatus Altiarchaeota archaeon]